MASTAEPTQSRHDLPDEKISIVGFMSYFFSPVSKLEAHGTSLEQVPGHAPDYSSATFIIVDEDHTLGNVLRYMVLKKWVYWTVI
jgi:hypothetical protein